MIRSLRLFGLPVSRFSTSSLMGRERKRFVIKEMTDEEYETDMQQPRNKKKTQTNKRPRKEIVPEQIEVEQEIAVEKTYLDLKFEKVTNSNASDSFGKLIRSMSKENFRKTNKLLLVNGVDAVKKAMELNDLVKSLYFSSHSVLKNFPLDNLETLKLCHVPPHIINQYQGIIEMPVSALITTPNTETNKLIRKKTAHEITQLKRTNPLPITVLCCDVTDASELGKIIKSAAVMDCEKVMTLKRCSDVWSYQTLKSAQNKQLEIEVIPGLDWNVLQDKFNFSKFTLLVVNMENSQTKNNELHTELKEEMSTVTTATTAVTAATTAAEGKEIHTRLFRDMEWDVSSKYLLMINNSNTRNFRNFVQETKFKQIVNLKLNVDDVTIQTDVILFDAMNKLSKMSDGHHH